jgi:hypothetical protein
MGQNQSAEHTALVNEILLTFGSRKDLTLWKNATGAVKIGERFLRFGQKGSPDILGLADGGTFLGIEVKTGNARQTPEQKLFEAMVFRRRGVYILARCLEDVEIGLARLASHSEPPPYMAS